MGDVIPFPARGDGSPKMYCGGCGADRTIPANAAITACPHCGSMSRTSHYGVVVVGEGITVTMSHTLPFTASRPFPNGPR